MKRFTDTLKWQDPWFRRLSMQSKLLWFYLVDHCDNIGLVDLDLNLVSSDCGTKITDAHISELSDRVQVLDDGKVFITKFIPFQYGTLSEACIPHRKVIQAVKHHSLTQTFNGFLYPTHRVVHTLPCRVSDSAKDKDKEEEENKEAEKNTSPTLPFDDPDFADAWKDWQQHRKEKKKPLTPTSTKLQLQTLEEMGVDRAIKAIDHSIAQGWTGIFEPNQPNQTSKQGHSDLGRVNLR
jgi:hypothetical protein